METTLVPTRAVLEGIERVHFYEGNEDHCPEDITFPAVMRVIMETLGENLGCKHHRPLEKSWGLGCAYSYFTGVSGLAFALNWEPGWSQSGGTFAVMEHLPGGRPEMFRRAFKAVGYSCEYVPPEAGEAAMREKIKASIYEHHKPVISIGVVGPPEAGIITGYDEDGEVLLGWNFFQKIPEFAQGIELEPSGYYRKRDWFKETQGILLVGEKEPVPPQDEIFLDTLKWGVEIARTAQSDGVATGLAAFDAWIAAIQRDEDFPAGNEAILRQRQDVHGFAVGHIAEARWYGSQWLIDTFEKVHYNKAEQLLKAAGCFAGEHELMWVIWDLAGGISNPDAWRKFAEPEVRAQIVPVLKACRDKDVEAIELIEEALRKS